MWTFTGGRPETECGAGSRIADTATVRAWLPEVLKRLEVNILLDVPCGDFNWLSQTDLSSVNYIGADSDPRHLRVALSKSSSPENFCPKSKRLILMDVMCDPLPDADCIMCRDFLQHLPMASAWLVVEKFMDSKAKYLIMTSHDNPSNDDIAEEGDFRPLNLTLSPFDLPPPNEFVEDCGRTLGLWQLR